MTEPASRNAVDVRGLHIAFASSEVVRGVDLTLPSSGISVLIGRSGSGKTTLLRALNRLNDEIPACRIKGQIELDFGSGPVPLYPEAGRRPMELAALRRRVGMVFQTPQVFPASIRRNMHLPLTLVGGFPSSELDDRMKAALMQAELWDEVADRLDGPAERLSGGQQQRLCLARALALEPSFLLLDEPTASLDVHAARHVEDLLHGLAERCTVIMASHSLGQSLRLAGTLAVMGAGRLLHCFRDTSGLAERDLEALLLHPSSCPSAPDAGSPCHAH
ncbi:phosphate ABC transporter ATP-binding protein [Mailhella sp.]|uniref:phosphate ABC transporter ATP-binding protein n=1 Tax=Mailhella sp. TaxID=1981029 RepID=UPI004063A2D1